MDEQKFEPGKTYTYPSFPVEIPPERALFIFMEYLRDRLHSLTGCVDLLNGDYKEHHDFAIEFIDRNRQSIIAVRFQAIDYLKNHYMTMQATETDTDKLAKIASILRELEKWRNENFDTQ
ncbi:MAG: hypothetical protein ACPG7F_14280 [Aggregatilineales bacterium]